MANHIHIHVGTTDRKRTIDGKMTGGEICSYFGIPRSQITITNGSQRQIGNCKIYNKDGDLIFKTENVWNGVVTLNQSEISEIGRKLYKDKQS